MDRRVSSRVGRLQRSLLELLVQCSLLVLKVVRLEMVREVRF
jgi:hypothetical protein